jgi:hypothetical protein
MDREPEEDSGRGRICIVVHQDVYDGILPGLLQYHSDYVSAGATPQMEGFTNPSVLAQLE